MNIHYFLIAPFRLATLAIPVVSTTVLWTNFALAQSALTPPANPRMTETAYAGFKSVLEGYKSYTEEKTVDWKAANDTTAQIGGWRAYAKEASQSEGKMPDSKSGGNKP